MNLGLCPVIPFHSEFQEPSASMFVKENGENKNHPNIFSLELATLHSIILSSVLIISLLDTVQKLKK